MESAQEGTAAAGGGRTAVCGTERPPLPPLENPSGWAENEGRGKKENEMRGTTKSSEILLLKSGTAPSSRPAVALAFSERLGFSQRRPSLFKAISHPPPRSFLIFLPQVLSR